MNDVTPVVGARYQTRNGRVVEIDLVEEDGTGVGRLLGPNSSGGEAGRWTSQGHYNFAPGMSHFFDLVFRLKEDPQMVPTAPKGLNEPVAKQHKA